MDMNLPDNTTLTLTERRKLLESASTIMSKNAEVITTKEGRGFKCSPDHAGKDCFAKVYGRDSCTTPDEWVIPILEDQVPKRIQKSSPAETRLESLMRILGFRGGNPEDFLAALKNNSPETLSEALFHLSELHNENITLEDLRDSLQKARLG